MGIVVSDFSRCVPVSEWETGWGISGHSGDVGFGSPCLTFPSAGSDQMKPLSPGLFIGLAHAPVKIPTRTPHPLLAATAFRGDWKKPHGRQKKLQKPGKYYDSSNKKFDESNTNYTKKFFTGIY